MRVVVLHSELTEGVRKDEDDVLIQAGLVSRALSNLGYEPILMPFSMDNRVMAERLRALAPSFVFNLLETVEAAGRLIYMAPAMLDHIAISYTGAATEAIFLTSNKIVAKRFLTNAGMPTPHWVSVEDIKRGTRVNAGTYIIKSVWEHASIGLDDDAIVSVNHPEDLLNELTTRKEKLGGECFAEIFVEGREFNLSLLAASNGPEVLPPAEIIFQDFPPEKPKVVGYTAKWEPDSFEYHNTPRHFEFVEEDAPLLEELERIALNCWDLFALRGYARVDFRVDASGNPWVLEVNTNPCLSPDAGFVAAAEQAGLSFDQVVARIVADSGGAENIHLRINEKPEGRQVLSQSGDGSGREFPIIFREEVKPEDCESVRRIAVSSGFFSPDEVRVAVELVEERLGKGLESGYYFLFAEQEGRVIGYTCFGPIACTKASYDLYWIAVHNDFRGLAIGRELLFETFRVIESLGGIRIYVETSSRPQYAPTRSFYSKYGFEQEAVLKDFYDHGDHKILYSTTNK
jgi:D-alanine-D-alanine ligase